MNQHFKILGILYLVMSGMHVVGGIVAGTVLSFVGSYVNDYEGEQVMSILAVVLPTILITMSIPGIVAGIGLLYRKQWALILAAVLAVFNIFNIPLGTALSIYTFYVVVQQNDIRRQDELREASKIAG